MNCMLCNKEWNIYGDEAATFWLNEQHEICLVCETCLDILVELWQPEIESDDCFVTAAELFLLYATYATVFFDEYPLPEMGRFPARLLATDKGLHAVLEYATRRLVINLGEVPTEREADWVCRKVANLITVPVAVALLDKQIKAERYNAMLGVAILSGLIKWYALVDRRHGFTNSRTNFNVDVSVLRGLMTREEEEVAVARQIAMCIFKELLLTDVRLIVSKMQEVSRQLDVEDQ